MASDQIPLHVAWRRWYCLNRYCAQLSQKELNRRIRDIVLNMIKLKDDAKISLLDWKNQGAYWMELWTHVLEEMSIRYGPYPAGFTRDILHSEPFPDFTGKLAAKAASCLKEHAKQDVLIKFGRPDYMKTLHESGKIRIQSASHYSKPDYNGAVRDDELALTMSLRVTHDDIVSLVSNPQDVPFDAQPQRIDITYQLDQDYWIYCLTQTIHPRLFVDFEAYSCVVIYDTKEFSERLNNAFIRKIPSSISKFGKIKYIDPLHPPKPPIDISMSKHFRYSYQEEYRFTWITSPSSKQLPPVDLDLGSLIDISQLIIIE